MHTRPLRRSGLILRLHPRPHLPAPDRPRLARRGLRPAPRASPHPLPGRRGNHTLAKSRHLILLAHRLPKARHLVLPARRLLLLLAHLLPKARHLVLPARRLLLLLAHLVLPARHMVLPPRSTTPHRRYRRGPGPTLRSDPFMWPSRYRVTTVGGDSSG
jgi:hypothetical protein